MFEFPIINLGIKYFDSLMHYIYFYYRSTIKERSEEFVTKLTMANVGQRPLIWVAHSMGGLLIKKMLVEGTYKLNIY